MNSASFAVRFSALKQKSASSGARVCATSAASARAEIGLILRAGDSFMGISSAGRRCVADRAAGSWITHGIVLKCDGRVVETPIILSNRRMIHLSPKDEELIALLRVDARE